MEQNFYSDKLLELKENFSVKVISGVRGVGKSSLLKNFAETLRAQGEEIIFIDCEENPRLKNFQRLYEFVDGKTQELEKFFLLIDEIDRVDEWEKAINALFVGTPAEIYVTGSSETLAENISVLLPENCDVLKMHPLPFAEVEKIYSSAALERYLHFGGMPAALDADKIILPRLLRGLVYEILFDLAEKNFLSDASLLRMLTKFLARNVGGAITVSEYLKSIDENNLRKVRNYLGVIFDLGLFKKIPRFDVKASNFLTGNEKIYCVDNGILNALAQVNDLILMENAVCIELLRRGFSVSVGKFGAMTINFVAERGGEKLFIQVLPPDNSVTPRRITRPLRALPEDAEKLLISLKPVKTFGGVKNLTLRDFLLDA
ncbi:MAG: ATP-binding protein [Selenomonadaceae bacterium]|nr:ATP-binding protein [Selenomonadaceae bacterium]